MYVIMYVCMTLLSSLQSQCSKAVFLSILLDYLTFFLSGLVFKCIIFFPSYSMVRLCISVIRIRFVHVEQGRDEFLSSMEHG